ncbi:MAG TPA: type II toxin-antitoxin system RelE/ParE family toxin [Candidatus Omnitrophota bacterium]|nr:type II toxin-antitoxin system RelE/ParE family toxin [Candidatus Omnitrophota bacterium]
MSSREYEIRITHRAEKDIKKLSPKLKDKLYDVLTEVIAKNPFEGKKLLGDLEGSYSYRLTYQDRIVYSVDTKKRIVYIERARTHYGD